MIEVTDIRSGPALEAIRGEWSDLWQRCSGATPFASPEWLLPWWRHLFGGGELWTIAVWRERRLIGLAPCFLYGARLGELSLLGSGVTDYLDFLVHDDWAEAAAQAICEHLAEAAQSWECCDLVEIPPESALLRTRFPTGLRIGKFASSVCPVLQLPPCREAWESQLPAKFRHHLRNSRTRVLNMGARFETSSARMDQEFLEALFHLHGARWTGRGQTGMLASAGMRDFLREVAREFRGRDWLRLYGLRYRGSLRAVVCIFCTPRRWLYYLGGFDQELARLSPGNLLLHFAIGQAIEQRTAEFDFLRNGEPYKYKWGARDRTNTRIVIGKETSAATR